MTDIRIAIVGPAFFGYLRRIAALLTERGMPAQFYDEFPSNRVIAKIVLRYSPLSIRQRITRAFHVDMTDRIIRSGATHVLFGTIEMFPHDCIRRLRNAGIVMCRYAWDSVANKPYARTLDPFMRAIGSFDPQDCEREGYVYIPLFSSVPALESHGPRSTDFMYCATFHSNRPLVIQRVIHACQEAGWQLKLMLFYHSRRLWFLRYIMHLGVWRLGRLFATRPYSLEDIARETAKARVVLDIHHQGQSGLTMRTFEALSLGTIVLTTNAVALEGLPEELRDRIAVLDTDNIRESMRHALTKPCGTLSRDMRYYVSAERFLDQIIELLLGEPAPAEVPGDFPLTTCEFGR